MGVDHVLYQRNKIFRHQIKPTGSAAIGAAIVRRQRSVQIVVCSISSAHIRIDHSQELDESRRLVMIVI